MKHKAYVSITLKVEITQGWNKECTLERVRDQAIKSAEGRINNIFMAAEKPIQGITLEGKPTVKIAFIELEE